MINNEDITPGNVTGRRYKSEGKGTNVPMQPKVPKMPRKPKISQKKSAKK